MTVLKSFLEVVTTLGPFCFVAAVVTVDALTVGLWFDVVYGSKYLSRTRV